MTQRNPYPNSPRFRVDKTTQPYTVWLQCSRCEKDIRPIGVKEKIKVTRGYLCPDCDDGTIPLNIKVER